jgi:hypothetical protein
MALSLRRYAMNNKKLLNHLPNNHPQYKEIFHLLINDELPPIISNDVLEELFYDDQAFNELALKDFNRAIMNFSNLYLSQKQKTVLFLRIGLSSGTEVTFDSCGKAACTTASSARELYHRGLRKLRHPRCSTTLKEYLVEYGGEW